jgi:hypothetical protein
VKFRRPPKFRPKYCPPLPAGLYPWGKPPGWVEPTGLDPDADEYNNGDYLPKDPSRSPFYWRVELREKYDPHRHWQDF